jgi:aryl-alcohol dehydrogenase-like predicted oxidoreductase
MRAALAWVLAQNDVTAPVVGIATTAQLQELLAAADLMLSPADLDSLTRAAAPARAVSTRMSNPPPTLISL